jgi:hypothetical protein
MHNNCAYNNVQAYSFKRLSEDLEITEYDKRIEAFEVWLIKPATGIAAPVSKEA